MAGASRARPDRAGGDLDDGGLEPRALRGAGARPARWAGPCPKVTRDWNSIPWAKPLVLAALVSLRRRLPGIVRRQRAGAGSAGDLGVSTRWSPPRLARACHDAGLELIAWTVDELERMRRWRASAWTGSAPTIRGCSSELRLLGARTLDPQCVSRLEWPGAVRGAHHAHAAAAGSGTGHVTDADRIAPGTVMALVAMGLGVIVIANDFTALNVALPAIEQDFNVDVGTVAVGDQRLLPRVRDGDRHRRAARRHVRAPARLLHRQRRCSPASRCSAGSPRTRHG